MATNDLTAGQSFTDSQFVARVRAALAKACSAIQNESAGTPNHTQRIALVGRMLNNLDSYATKFATFVAVDSIVAAQTNLAAATDAQVETATNGYLDMFALQGV